MSTLRTYGSGWKGSLTAVLLATVALAGCGEEAGGEATVVEDHHELEGHDVVFLDSTALAIASIDLVPVRTIRASGLAVTGTITYDANQVSHIGPRIDGRIARLAADVGQRVRGGQVLAVLESPEVGQVRADEAEATALADIARENYQRERRLEEQGISSRKEVLETEAELRRAEAALSSARQRLQVLGAARGQGAQYALTAPFPGVVVERHASLGEMASPSDELFTVANLDRLWIELDIYERDLSRVSPGQSVGVTTAAYPGRTFPGRIVYVGDIVDPERRTVRTRVEVPNADGALKPGMFADALIRVGSDGPPVAVIPEEALQEVDGRPVVFVQGSRPGEFRVRAVEVGDALYAGQIVILSGLDPDERVVATGAFVLRSELAEGEIGEAGHAH